MNEKDDKTNPFNMETEYPECFCYFFLQKGFKGPSDLNSITVSGLTLPLL